MKHKKWLFLISTSHNCFFFFFFNCPVSDTVFLVHLRSGSAVCHHTLIPHSLVSAKQKSCVTEDVHHGSDRILSS